MSAREGLKAVARAGAAIAVIPALCSFYLRGLLLGRDRALHGSTEALSLVPGLLGQYLRRAFLARTIARCAPSAVIEFGTLFSSIHAHLDERVYIGPHCHIGFAHLERDVLVGPGVHIPSGPLTHGISDLHTPIRDQPGRRHVVRIGAGAWLGSAAVVLADIGPHTIVAAGAVVTHPIPEYVIAGGVPARVLRSRRESVPPDHAVMRSP